MGIKDNFSQAMKELTNPRSSDNRKEVKDVAAYMNDTADTQPGEPAQNAQPAQDNVQPSQAFGSSTQEQNVQNTQQGTAAGGFVGQDFSQRIARDMNDRYNQNNSFAQNMQNDQNAGAAQNIGDNAPGQVCRAIRAIRIMALHRICRMHRAAHLHRITAVRAMAERLLQAA